MADNSKEKFSLIYDQYIEKIYRFVYLKVSSQQIAEDVTSKVFLRGWDAYKKGQEIKNPGAFLYQIARNMIVDHYREKGKEKTISMDAIAQMADTSKSSFEKAAIRADIELIKSAITSLHKDYQDVIIWYYLEDMSAPQIAQLLGKPVGTVRVMIHRGLEALKGQMNKEV